MENAITPEQVRQAALHARLTLADFLNVAGVSRSTFYTWERTKQPPKRPLTLAKLADAVQAVA
jgi:transcriptional regulator with XRE-family HTH domain